MLQDVVKNVAPPPCMVWPVTAALAAGWQVARLRFCSLIRVVLSCVIITDAAHTGRVLRGAVGKRWPSLVGVERESRGNEVQQHHRTNHAPA